MRSPAGGAETGLTPFRPGKFNHLSEATLLDALDDQLGDPLALRHIEGFNRVGVDQQHLQLPPVSRIDEARGVQAGHPVSQSQAAAGLDKTREPFRNGDRHSGRNQRPTTTRGQGDGLSSHQIGARVTLAGVGRGYGAIREPHDRDLKHGGDPSRGRGRPDPLRSGPGPPPSALRIHGVLAWLDLEMTGLDPATDVIVEIATLLTDDDLEEVAVGPNLTVHQPAEVLERMSELVRSMHASSGLLDAIAASAISLGEAGEATLEFLRNHIPKPGTVPLCGNSIGTDRRFLTASLPEVDAYFHYRSIDVSTIKELARRWHPEVASSAPEKTGGHRALNDTRESIAELRHYREHLFTRP